MDLAYADERSILELRREEIRYVPQFLRAAPRVPAVDMVAMPHASNGDLDLARQDARAMLTSLGIRPELQSSHPAVFSGSKRLWSSCTILWFSGVGLREVYGLPVEIGYVRDDDCDHAVRTKRMRPYSAFSAHNQLCRPAGILVYDLEWLNLALTSAVDDSIDPSLYLVRERHEYCY